MLFRIPGKKAENRSDEELLAAYLSSEDPELLGVLYSRYMHLVYGVCLKYLADRDEAKDAVMAIFEKLVSELTGQEIGNFRSWLHVVTKNFCLMQLRSEKSRSQRLQEWINDPSVFMEYDEWPHPIDNDSRDMETELAECIKRLKESQKECVKLFYFENRSYVEIAGDLSIDEKTVKSNLQNARRNLKICLEEKNAQRV